MFTKAKGGIKKAKLEVIDKNHPDWDKFVAEQKEKQKKEKMIRENKGLIFMHGIIADLKESMKNSTVEQIDAIQKDFNNIIDKLKQELGK